MRLRHGKTLITGKPGVGKTTLVKEIIKRMGSINMAGFCTSKFERGLLGGGCRTLAHVDIDSRHRVGRYGVDTLALRSFWRHWIC